MAPVNMIGSKELSAQGELLAAAVSTMLEFPAA